MKISVIGAGNVGATAAKIIVDKQLANEVVLVDIVEGMPQGKALDIYQSAAVQLSDTKIVGTNDYSLTKDSDIVVITAGLPRKPGMSRDDLIQVNTGIVKPASIECAKYSPNSIIIIVSNPLDIMTYVALKNTGFPKHRVMGMSGVLDSARFKTFLSIELNVSIADISANVLGGHGDSMVPLTQGATVSGIPLLDLIQKDKLNAIIDRTKNGGAEIVKLLKTGSAYYAPAASTIQMIDAIVNDRHSVLPGCVYLEGEYGYSGICLGVPIKLGKNGVEEIIVLKLSDEEKQALDKSAGDVKVQVDVVNKIQ
jgi:malate dehydrogenase